MAPKNWKLIHDFSLSAPSSSFANEAENLMSPVTKLPDYSAAKDKAMDAFDTLDKDVPDEHALKTAVTDYFEELRKLTASIPDWRQRLDAYGVARQALQEMHAQLYKQIAKAPTLSFEYDFTRPPIVSATAVGTTQATVASGPDLSTIGLVYVASFYESEYTLNATTRFFDETQAGMRGNFRDLQLAGKWDIPVGKVPSFITKGTLTVSGLYEHLHQKPLGIELLINDQKVNRPGNMGVFQDGTWHHFKMDLGDPDHRDNLQRLRGVTEQDGVPPNHVDTRGHHGRRMDKCRDRRRTFHRVRQPDIQRNLR